MIPSMISLIENPQIQPQEKIRQLANMKTEAVSTIESNIKQIISPSGGDQEIPDKPLNDPEIDESVKLIFDKLMSGNKVTFNTKGTDSKENTTKILQKLTSQLEWVILADGSIKHS